MFDKIKSDLLESMKSGDKFKLGVLRMLKSALQMEQISLNHELSDDEVYNLIIEGVNKDSNISSSLRNKVINKSRIYICDVSNFLYDIDVNVYVLWQLLQKGGMIYVSSSKGNFF